MNKKLSKFSVYEIDRKMEPVIVEKKLGEFSSKSPRNALIDYMKSVNRLESEFASADGEFLEVRYNAVNEAEFRVCGKLSGVSSYFVFQFVPF